MTGTSLLERGAELDAAAALVAEAAAGSGRLLLVEGPAGIGKSRLLAEARRSAEASGMRVLAARVGELEREFPFGVVRQLFEAAARSDEDAFAGAAGPARTAFSDLADAGGEQDASFAVLHGLYWLALNLAERGPLLLAVDDLHWCDRPSLRFLAYLVRRLEGAPILLAATLRSNEPGTDPALLAELTQDPATVALAPGPLSEEAAGALVGAALGQEADPAFRRACHEATGGNPLLLRQLLAALAGDGVAPRAENVALVRELGPRAASRTVLLRLARLPADAVPVARAVAILGEAAELGPISDLARVDEARAAAAIGELTRADILAPGEPLDFVHPLVRETVYRELAPAERALEHARAAALLAAAGASDDRVAAQLLPAPPRWDPWVAERLHAAGTAARRRGAADGAVAYLRRALAEPPPPALRPRLLFDLGVAEALTDGHAAMEHLRAAFEELEEPAERAAAAEVLGRTLILTGDPEAGAEIARAALAALPEELADERLRMRALLAATVFFGAGERRDLRTLRAHRDERPADDAGAGAKMIAACAAVEWAYTGGQADACAALALSALRGGTLFDVDAALMGIVALIVLTVADREEAAAAWEEARARAHRTGSLVAIGAINHWHGFFLYRRGDLDGAERAAAAAAEDVERWGYGADARSYPATFVTLARVARGDLAGARAAADGIVETGSGSEAMRFAWHARLELLVAEGRDREALEQAAALEAIEGEDFVSACDVPWRGLAAIAHDRLGERDAALALAREELRRAEAWGGPWALGRALRILGTLEGEAGLPRLERAVAVLDGSTARLEHAEALAALGGALRRARRRTEAREPLRRALELASGCAATGLSERARTELYAAGARPRTDALGGLEALTASERRVVDLAAAGQSNRDIAQALYVTPKTVEVHLTNAYRKLGIRSRRELPGVVAAA